MKSIKTRYRKNIIIIAVLAVILINLIFVNINLDFSSFNQEKSNLHLNDIPIGFGEVISDSIDFPGDADNYTFSANADDTILVRMSRASGTALDPDIRLYDPNGNELIRNWHTSTTAEFLYTLSQSGIHKIMACDYQGNENGAYCIYVQRVNNPGNALSLAFGEPVSASIILQSEADTYTFLASAGDTVLVRMGKVPGSNLQHEARLYAPNGALLSQGSHSSYAVEFSYVLPENGMYTVIACDYTGIYFGSYHITVQRVNNPGNATTIEFGTTISDSIDFSGEIDSYTFSANIDETILVRMSRASVSTLDPEIRLYGPNGNELIKNFVTSTTAEFLYTLSQNGIYTIIACDNLGNENGAYCIYIQRVNNPGNALPIKFGEAISASISLQSEADTYTFPASAGDTILVRMGKISGNNFQHEARLYAPNGALLSQGSHSSYAVEFSYVLPENGMYSVIACDDIGIYFGSYFITVQRVNNPGNALRIEFNETVYTSIDFPGEADTFTFLASVDDVILVEMNKVGGNTLDPEIRLYGPNGNELIKDWDYTTAEFSYMVPMSGLYTVLACDNMGNEYGSYEISFQRLYESLSDTDNDGMPDGWELNNNLNPFINDSANDPDGDNLTNLQEYQNDTDPNDSDSDNDGLTDGQEVNIYSTDPNDSDSDNDGMPDGWEVNNSLNPLLNDSSGDPDSDYLANLQEYQNSTDPNDPDSDNDGMLDGWEINNSLNPLINDSSNDPDSDNLTNLQEYQNNTDPNDSDSDNDGLTDGQEINIYSTDPNDSDSDHDGMPDGWEVNNSLNPLLNDSSGDPDSDNLTNLQEYQNNTDPNDPDSDDDGLNDGVEINTHSTDPNDSDSDDDGLNDGVEIVTHSTDPNDSDSDDDGLNDGVEINTHSTDPNDSDSDGDQIIDGDEVNIYGTNPNKRDTDGDGVSDYDEIFTHNTDPNNIFSGPLTIPIIVGVIIVFSVIVFISTLGKKIIRNRRGSKSEKARIKKSEEKDVDILIKRSEELVEAANNDYYNKNYSDSIKKWKEATRNCNLALKKVSIAKTKIRIEENLINIQKKITDGYLKNEDHHNQIASEAYKNLEFEKAEEECNFAKKEIELANKFMQSEKILIPKREIKNILNKFEIELKNIKLNLILVNFEKHITEIDKELITATSLENEELDEAISIANTCSSKYSTVKMEVEKYNEFQILTNKIQNKIESTKQYQNKLQVTLSEQRNIEVTRGGDWRIEENQSIFYFKVKIRNTSDFVLTNIQILLTYIPNGLEPIKDRYEIKSLNPNSYESPTLKLKAKESCVGDAIKGTVLYTNHKGNQEKIDIEPFKIEYVCNLLVPKAITEDQFEQNVAQMHERKIIMECEVSPIELEPEITKILKENNFSLIDTLESSDSPNFRKLKAYAEGKYDHKDVGLLVIIQKMVGQKTKLIFKAMSDMEGKIVDLLRDLSRKCDRYKIAPEYSIEIICGNCNTKTYVIDDIGMRESIICEKCGYEIKL